MTFFALNQTKKTHVFLPIDQPQHLSSDKNSFVVKRKVLTCKQYLFYI